MSVRHKTSSQRPLRDTHVCRGSFSSDEKHSTTSNVPCSTWSNETGRREPHKKIRYPKEQSRKLKGQEEPKRSHGTEGKHPGAVTSGTDSSEDTESEEINPAKCTPIFSSGTESDSDLETGGQREISTMSFEELIELQNKVGTKQFYKTTRGAEQRTGAVEKKQLHKNQPLEVSSKKPVPYLRKVVQAKKEMRRDPRFDDLSGEYKPEVFEKTYKFLDDVKRQEKEAVQKKLGKARDPELKEKLEHLIRRMDQQEEAVQKKQKQRERELEFKRQQIELAQQGKKPFYMKKGDFRKLELADKYQELKKRGKLEHFLSKKRKRNSHKDRRRLPNN